MRGLARLLDLPCGHRPRLVRPAEGCDRGRGGHARPRLWLDQDLSARLPNHHDRGIGWADRTAPRRHPEHAEHLMAGLFDRLVAAAGPTWHSYTRHKFVLQLARGDLPEAAFRHYLIQDYLFLKHFARAWGLAVYKSDTLAEMRRAQGLVAATLDVEIGLHIDYCRSWDIDPARMEAAPEALPTV